MDALDERKKIDGRGAAQRAASIYQEEDESKKTEKKAEDTPITRPPQLKEQSSYKRNIELARSAKQRPVQPKTSRKTVTTRNTRWNKRR